MSDIQSRIAALSPAKRALLERSLREKADRQESKSIRPRRPEEKPLLSFGQQRLWILEQWQPGAAAYNISTVARIEGSLDTAALQRSLTEVVRRHETLRTTFAPGGDLPALIIHPPGVVEVQRVDLTALPEEQKESMAFEQMNAEVLRGFDLMTGPMFRCTLLQLAPQSHLLLLKVHHIVFDGWSMGLLYRELFTLYDAFAGGHSSPLSEPPVQYADFAAWQRRRLQGDLLSKVLNYWREQLRDLPTLDLPTDHPRPPGQTFIGATQKIHLPPILVAALKSLSRQEGATLFMTLLAAFQILLHRYSGQDDLVVGTPIAGRTRAEVEELIGFFVNMLVLRTDASGDPSFRELLARTNKTALGAYAHQDLPFEKLVEELHPRRDPSRNPLFQVVFALQSMPHSSPTFGRVHVTRVNLEKATTRFDLEVDLQDVDKGLAGVFVYNTALFEAETIARMTKHFQTVLEAVATNPDLRLSEAPLLAEEERRQLLVDWNDTGTPYPRDTGVASLFEARAQATPDALAVTFGKQRMTYRQLNERANRLARHLRTLGVGRDVLAGICVERSLDMIVGMLGILKAGGAYVPIEPSYPRERVAFMLRDANVRVLLTHENLARNLPETHVHVVHVDDRRFDHGNSDNPDSGTAAADIAYVIYTSGSTGQPKGVAVPHRAVVRLVLNTNYAQLGPADRVAQGSNSSFDAATFEIWGALLNGAALIGIPQAVLLSPKDFARELQEQKITTLFLTTALFNQMAISAPTMFGSLRYLLVGGEAFDMNSGRRVLRHGAPQHLLNAYGPTESATFATWHRVQNPTR